MGLLALEKEEQKIKVLIVTEGNWLSHISRSLQIGRALRHQGHLIEFSCTGQFVPLIEKEGFSVLPIYTKDPGKGLARARKSGSSYDDETVRTYVEAETKLIDERAPDVVVGDFRLPLSISTEICRVPYVSILNGYWTNYYTASHSAPSSMQIVSVLGQSVADLFFPFLRRMFLKIAAKPFNKERRRRGLAPIKNLFEVMQSNDLNLIVDIPSYTPQYNLPPHFHFVGPIVWEPNLPEPEWLKKLDRARPIIYFTMGSTGFTDFFNVALDLFADAEFQVLFTGGGMDLPEDRPANFFVEEYAPGLKIMEMSDLVVCHGGNGTIYQALSRGVPIVGIPTMHDQWFNMERVEDLGVGLKLDKKKFMPSHLAEAVEKILADQSYTNNIEPLRGEMARYDAPQKAAELIANLAAHDNC